MNLYSRYAIIFTICCCVLQFKASEAYPTLNLRHFSDFGAEKYKKSDPIAAQLDEEVYELEDLKRTPEAGVIASSAKNAQIESEIPVAVDAADAIKLPYDKTAEPQTPLEPNTAAPPVVLEPETFAEADTNGGDVMVSGQGAHRPPTLQHNDGGKATYGSNSNQQQVDDTEGTAGVPSMTKPFYGAARLAFGQNPEVLTTTTNSPSTPTPTTSTSQVTTATPTTTTTTSKTTDATLVTNNVTTLENQETNLSQPNQNAQMEASTATSVPKNVIARESVLEQPHNYNNQAHKETISDVILSLAAPKKSTASRRSISASAFVAGPTIKPKTAEDLLRNHKGHYSSFDMAQYIFWTGDEAGVARAVEEFIDQGLISRESALKFLRDIRIGIDYLEQSYANRAIPDEVRENHIKKNYPAPAMFPQTTTTTTTTEQPLPRLHMNLEESIRRGSNARMQKALDSISIWNKLKEINRDQDMEDSNDYSEANGRAKIAEFLYSEYSVEDILYNLAKVMFTQSLAHGSDEAQRELQKLTDFLEREGNRGVIPLDLQRKVLHVLLSALSDTLREHPELLPAARENLGGSTINSDDEDNMPVRNYDTYK